jgi:hypothetical protein
MDSMHRKGLDDRSRNENGEIHRKRGDTHLATLRETYPGLLPGVRGDAHLDTLRERFGVDALSELVRAQPPTK